MNQQRLRLRLGALPLTQYENQRSAKHVESLSATCLDAGSTPANSTRKYNAFFYSVLRNIFLRLWKIVAKGSLLGLFSVGPV